MKSSRKIKKVMSVRAILESAGVHQKRAFGCHQIPLFDSFLLLDDFYFSNLGHYLKDFPEIGWGLVRPDCNNYPG
jgi:hypothetical protein